MPVVDLHLKMTECCEPKSDVQQEYSHHSPFASSDVFDGAGTTSGAHSVQQLLFHPLKLLTIL